MLSQRTMVARIRMRRGLALIIIMYVRGMGAVHDNSLFVMAKNTIEEENEVIETFKTLKSYTADLLRDNHAKYMLSNLTNLGEAIIHFDYGQPWIYYYILHSLTLLGKPLPEEHIPSIIKGLKYCWNEQKGGFGGGYKQLPHLAPTYAAFLSILIIGPRAYHLLDKEGLTKFFRSCKKGSQYQIAEGAELDLRACYIVSIIVKLLKLDESLLDGVAETII